MNGRDQETKWEKGKRRKKKQRTGSGRKEVGTRREEAEVKCNDDAHTHTTDYVYYVAQDVACVTKTLMLAPHRK